eukprot:1963507-Rhodomonas_salina.2
MKRLNPFLPSHLQTEARSEKAIKDGKDDTVKIYAGMVTAQMSAFNPSTGSALPVAKTRLGIDPLSELGLHQKPISDTPELIGPVNAPMPAARGPHVRFLPVEKSVGESVEEKVMYVTAGKKAPEDVNSSDLELRVEKALQALEEKEMELQSKSLQLDLKAKQLEVKTEQLDDKLVQVKQLQEHAAEQMAAAKQMRSTQMSRSGSYADQHTSAYKTGASHLIASKFQSLTKATMASNAFSDVAAAHQPKEEEEHDNDITQWMPINMNRSALLSELLLCHVRL